ncbi:MAG: hypothetical protein R3200_13535 [Xanthomonadales bacterium]|nr:hypothetical protein [Xanthomonadales bacterium]
MLASILFCLLVAPFALAAPPADPNEQSVPAQLTTIQTTLAEFEARLMAEMAAMEGRLDLTLAEIRASADAGNDKLVLLQASADELQVGVDELEALLDDIFDVVTEVNIEMTTTLCFDAGAKFEGAVGIHDEVGIGWPNVLSAKAILQGEGGIGGELAVASEICVEVPLYSVPSTVSMFTNTAEFDDLIAAVALPSQEVVPMLANVYTLMMPTPDQAFQAIGNVTEASSGYNVYTGSFGPPNPAAFLRPDVLLEPVLPLEVLEFINQVPEALEAALLDPCGTLEATPIGAALQGRDDIEFLCTAHANIFGPLATTVEGLFDVLDVVLDIIDPLNLYH